uniref:SCP domain-containing protein n=1 Tax=Strongyloides papillosus TaxID=174720 RepID=A0A0N5BMB3_STREA
MNIIRLYHGVPSLRRSPLLDIFAQHQANKMANLNKLIRDPTTEYGVSIITKWYDQRNLYYYTVGRGSYDTKEFTQLVWKNSDLVGVGAASNGTHVFFAAYYYPRVIYITCGHVRGKPFKSDNKRISLPDGEDSDRKNSGKKKPVKKNSVIKIMSNRKSNSSSPDKSKHNKHKKSSKKRKPSCNRYNRFSITQHLSKNSYSKSIYLRVWGGCDYKCFCQNNFKLFSKNVLMQINLLRISHGAPFLLEYKPLEKIAKLHANMMAKESKLLVDPTSKYGVTVSLAYNPLASLIVTKWYDECNQYDYSFSCGSPETDEFTQLVWKNSKAVGVGVATNGSHVFVAVYYYPKGNIPDKFKKNVCKQKAKLVWKNT